MSIIQVNITHCPKRDHSKGLTLTVAWSTNSGIIELLVFTSMQARRLASVCFAFMFRRKEIYKQIDEFGRDKQLLDKLAKFCKRDRIQDISLEDLKNFHVVYINQISTMYFRIIAVKNINKFLRQYGMPFVLKLDEIVEIMPNSGIIESMKMVSKYDPTPRTRRNMRIVQLKDKGWSYSDICAEYGFRSKATPYNIYHREKKRM